MSRRSEIDIGVIKYIRWEGSWRGGCTRGEIMRSLSSKMKMDIRAALNDLKDSFDNLRCFTNDASCVEKRGV